MPLEGLYSVQLKGISKTFLSLSSSIKVKVFSNINEKYHSGLVIFTGQNGSGKSTLLRIIAGIIKPSTGHVSIKKTARIGYLPQNPKFHKQVSPLTFINFLIRLSGTKNRFSKDLAKKWLDIFNISDKFRSLPIEFLSEGMKRRLGLAIAFCTDPDIYLLDEPMENLDKDGQQVLLQELEKKIQDNKLILIASHNHSVFHKFNPQFLDLDELKVSFNNRSESA